MYKLNDYRKIKEIFKNHHVGLGLGPSRLTESGERKLKLLEKREAFSKNIKILNQEKLQHQKYYRPNNVKKISQREKAWEFAKSIKLPKKKDAYKSVFISKNEEKLENDVEFYSKKHKEYLEKIKKIL